MTPTCPTCNKAVDPLRSRFAGVQGGKVVAYCSAECAAPAQRAHPPVADPGAASLSTGVPTRIPTPPAGIPALARSAPTGVPDGPPRPITPAPGVPIDIDSGPVIEILHEPASDAVTRARDERTEPRAKPSGELPADPGSAPIPLPRAGRDATAAPAAIGRVTARSRTDRALSEDEPHDEAAPPRKSRASLVLLILLLLGAGGLLAYQYLMKHDLAAATRVLPAPAAPPAPTAQASQVSVAEPVRPPAAGVNPAGDVAVDVAAAVEQARATLQANLTATSQRVSRLAAAALARTQDHAACDTLAAQLGLGSPRDLEPHPGSAGLTADGAAKSRAPQPARQPETSDIAKLDLAYSLARGGDKRGSDALAAALGSQRADVRDEAARLLALLGDHRAVPHLTDVLSVSQRRLGAAEHLAHLAEPHALKILEQLRGDAKASADDKTRATIALGLAGHPDVAPELRDMLGDAHFNAFAAAALAELKDDAARPVLEHQLESPALRVRAARALRRLDPTLDPRPVLPHLLEVLKSGRDIDQIQAAEAILLLAGPASWSAYD